MSRLRLGELRPGRARDQAEALARGGLAAVSWAGVRPGQGPGGESRSQASPAPSGCARRGVGDYVKDAGETSSARENRPDQRWTSRYKELFQSKIQCRALWCRLTPCQGKPYSGRSLSTPVDPQLDTAGRTSGAAGADGQPGGALKPGMFARDAADAGRHWRHRGGARQSVAMRGEEQIMFRVGSMAAPCLTKGRGRSASRWQVEIVEGIGGSDTIVVAGWRRVRWRRGATGERWQPRWQRRYNPRLVRRRSRARRPHHRRRPPPEKKS